MIGVTIAIVSGSVADEHLSAWAQLRGRGTMSDRLTTNQSMANDAPLVSGDGRYAAYLQSDANLVLCYAKNGAADLSRPYWSCAANAGGNYVNGGRRQGAPYVAVMQSD